MRLKEVPRSTEQDLGGVDNVGISADELYRRHAGEALQVARAITRNVDDAADAVAEAFAGVLRALSDGRLDEPQAVRPYLLAATRNASVDIIRKAGRLRPTDHDGTLDGAEAAFGPSERLLAGEDRALVAEAFAELPPRWRAVLWLIEVEALAPREAAALLQVSPNNAAQLAVRARSRLRERYIQMHVRNHAAGDCREAAEHLGGLMAGELTTVQANRVRGHLAECADCRARLGELEDLGLTLRRAAMPLPLVGLERLRRWRWPWKGRSGPRSPAWLGRVDPSVPATVAGLGTSPAVQQVAATVATGLLVLAIGAAVVRHDHRRAPAEDPRRPGVEAAGPAAAAVVVTDTTVPGQPAEPTTTTSTSVATTTTAVAPPTTVAAAVAAPASAVPFEPRGALGRSTVSMVAHALVSQLGVYDAPGTAGPGLALANPQPSGAPLVLLVTARQGDWLQALLPVRPNGSTGWIRAADVRLVTHDFRIVVELGAHRLTAYQGTEVLVSEPIGVGTADAPTPGGLYYIKELFEPVDRAGNPDPGGPYGPYAYGLSGFSEVLFEFGGGDGQFGIHGTNDPSGLGRDVSHGCIRISNEAITFLAGTLPLGAPVEIHP